MEVVNSGSAVGRQPGDGSGSSELNEPVWLDYVFLDPALLQYVQVSPQFYLAPAVQPASCFRNTSKA